MNVLADRASDTQRRAPTYQVLVDDIKALGVEQVFGLMSDDTAVFATALDSSGIRFYGARHENNAIAMAEGFAYATGGLGVAVIGRGPATANGLHAATYASRAGSRVLIIYGDAAVSNGSRQFDGPGLQGLQCHRCAGRRRHSHLRRDQPRDRPRRAGRCRRRGAAGRRGGVAAAGQRPARRHGSRRSAAARRRRSNLGRPRRRSRRPSKRPPPWCGRAASR